MKMIIENIPAYNIVYFRRRGAYGPGNIEVMNQIKNFAKSRDLFGDDTIILGIAQDNPMNIKAEDCRYDACLVTNNYFNEIEKSISNGKISGGKYAVFIIEHTPEAVSKAWSEVFLELNNKGILADYSRPIIERYQNKMVNDKKCEICIPLK